MGDSCCPDEMLVAWDAAASADRVMMAGPADFADHHAWRDRCWMSYVPFEQSWWSGRRFMPRDPLSPPWTRCRHGPRWWWWSALPQTHNWYELTGSAHLGLHGIITEQEDLNDEERDAEQPSPDHR